MRNHGPGSELAHGSHADLEGTRLLVERVLRIELEPRESLYMGGDYFLGRLPGGGQVRVRANRDLMDDCPEWPSWPGPVFAEISGESPGLASGPLPAAGLPPLTGER